MRTISIAYGNPIVGSNPAAPELLDRLVALGELAQQISLVLEANGHRKEQMQEMMQVLEGHK